MKEVMMDRLSKK